ncbi:MAG: ADP-heptose synthase / D-glycero-beta-D-manno-heptose 7-phosphate kinase, partial [uncultured Gemmatimonadaceae bacterium]
DAPRTGLQDPRHRGRRALASGPARSGRLHQRRLRPPAPRARRRAVRRPAAGRRAHRRPQQRRLGAAAQGSRPADPLRARARGGARGPRMCGRRRRLRDRHPARDHHRARPRRAREGRRLLARVHRRCAIRAGARRRRRRRAAHGRPLHHPHRQPASWQPPRVRPPAL